MAQAKVGGQYGRNGEFYKGGQFLPSTELPKLPQRKRGGGKQEIAPRTWEVAPEGMRSIYRTIIGYCKWADGKWGEKVELFESNLTPPDNISELIEKWNNGERWMTEK